MTSRFLSQSSFQPLSQRDACVTLVQWMWFLRQCNLCTTLNLSLPELQRCFEDARCGIQEGVRLQAHVFPRMALDLQQFTQGLVFVVRSVVRVKVYVSIM